jgi:aspartate racemase
LAIIRSIKANGPNDFARGGLAAASAALKDEGAAVQIIACTEFSLIAGAVDPTIRCFDTLDCLVAGIIAFATASGGPVRRAAG